VRPLLGAGGEWRMQMSRLCFALKRSRSHNLCKVFNLIQHTRAGWLVGLLAVRRRSIMFFALGCDLRLAGHDLQKAIRGGDHSRWKLWPQPPAKSPVTTVKERNNLGVCIFYTCVCERASDFLFLSLALSAGAVAILSCCSGGRCQPSQQHANSDPPPGTRPRRKKFHPLEQFC
jgi:hypothetical protein